MVSDGPENLRSVEEILKEMKEKEYCVADSIPIASTTPEWQREIDYDEQELGSHRNTFLAGKFSTKSKPGQNYSLCNQRILSLPFRP